MIRPRTAKSTCAHIHTHAHTDAHAHTPMVYVPHVCMCVCICVSEAWRYLLGKQFSAKHERVMQKFSEPCQYSPVFVIENEINLLIFSHVSQFRKILSIFFIRSTLRLWFIWQDNIKCALSSITPHHLQRLYWIGVFGLMWRPRSMAKVCELARICAIALRNGTSLTK